MNIATSLLDKSVLQRNNKGVCDVMFAGTCGFDGKLELGVKKNGKRFSGNLVCVGSAKKGKFSGRLKGLPAGGPYDICISVVDRNGKTLESRTVESVFVGDVWILGGQSNMQGCGLLKDAASPDPRVRAFYMNDEWDMAVDPVHHLCDAIDPVHGGRMDGKRTKPATVTGVGPGIAFGLEMLRRTGVPQGLIACAHGGTSMSQWDPALKKKGGASFYGAMMRRFRKTGEKVAGIAWYQGCNDASAPETALLYTNRMKKLVRAMRRDFNDAKLPFVAVQIGRYIRMGNAKSWLSVQDQQRKLPDVIPGCLVVPAIDLELDDAIHISGVSQQVLGQRIAQAMSVLKGVKHAGKPPIALKSVKVAREVKRNLGKVVVSFANVSGRLFSKNRASGFTLGNPEPIPGIVKIKPAGNKVMVYTDMQEGILKGCFINYGYGADPYCNITDSEGRPLPVFGPIALGEPVTESSFVKKLRVSRAVPLKKGIESVAYPKKKSELKFKTVNSDPAHFFDFHNDMFKPDDVDLLAFFLCEVACVKEMKAKIGIGYDGPLKVWINRKQWFCDPNGCNPAGIDKVLFPVTLKKGKNEILLAMSSNMGKAWGVYLRVSRAGLTHGQLDSEIPMPEILG